MHRACSVVGTLIVFGTRSGWCMHEVCTVGVGCVAVVHHCDIGSKWRKSAEEQGEKLKAWKLRCYQTMQSGSAHERDLQEDSYSSPQKGSVGEQVDGPFSSEIATTSTATPPVSSLSPVLSIPHRTPSTVPHSAKPYAFSSKRKQAAHRARVLSVSTLPCSE